MRFLLSIILISLISKASALTIVTTIPSLVNDVKLIAPNDEVYGIPAYSHDYQLTSRDVEMLKSADLIVSTAHTHFEEKVREMVESGEIKAELIEIPKIEGMKLLKYPETEKTNYHMPIYDPYNYKLFLIEIAKKLESLNPKENYVERARDVCRKVEMINFRYNGTAIVDYPYGQYAVSWMGLKVVGIFFNSPTTPEKFKEVDYLVITRNSEKSIALIENIPHKYVIYIDSPFANNSILQKLEGIEVRKSVSTPGYNTSICILAVIVLWLLRNGY